MNKLKHGGWIDTSRLTRAVDLANQRRRPLYLIILATKPCYIKLASLVHECVKLDIQFLLIDSGQHYDDVLVAAQKELGYANLVDAMLCTRGTLLERASQLAYSVEEIRERLQAIGLVQPAVPVVSGDTSTAAFFPPFWYFAHGVRSIHVEAGLRSEGPSFKDGWENVDDLTLQRSLVWQRFGDEPFPEAVDSCMASVCSDLLLAPVRHNITQLLREGYSEQAIVKVGSLSSDAVGLALSMRDESTVFERYPELLKGKWLRVDLHRRENMTPARLNAVMHGLLQLRREGVQIILIRTNALMAALRQHNLLDLLAEAERGNIVVHDLWESYVDVISFISSEHCLALYTDSGGLQEEANILRVPTLTCRFSTDRPETVLEGKTSLLLPPVSPNFVHRHLSNCLRQERERVWPGIASEQCMYGMDVGLRIAEVLQDYRPQQPLDGSRVHFSPSSACDGDVCEVLGGLA